MTAMDFRQYDNALGRFNSLDVLSEFAPGISPYRFAYNNPVFWADPSGLFETKQAAMDHIQTYGLSGATVSYNDSRGYWEINNNGYTFGYENGNFKVIYDTEEGFISRVISKATFASWGDNFSGITNTGAQTSGEFSSQRGVQYDLSYIGNTIGAGGIVYAGLENAIANKYWWMDSKGKYNFTKILKKGANGKYVRGVQGLRNGYNSALKIANGYKIAGNTLGGLGLGITYIQYKNGQISATEASVDAFFGVVGFFGPIGAGISAAYFVGKLGYEYFSGNDLFEKPQ